MLRQLLKNKLIHFSVNSVFNLSVNSVPTKDYEFLLAAVAEIGLCRAVCTV